MGGKMKITTKAKTLIPIALMYFGLGCTPAVLGEKQITFNKTKPDISDRLERTADKDKKEPQWKVSVGFTRAWSKVIIL